MFATAFVNTEDGYKLIVDSSRHETAEQWLKVQECNYQNYHESGRSIFVLTNASDGVIYRLHQKYGSACNDNDVVQAGLENLREALTNKTWTAIVEQTQNWTKEFKIAVWKHLNSDERKEIRFLSLKYQDQLDFQERLYATDQKIVKKMVILLKEVGLIDKRFKVANQTTKDFIEVIMSDFVKNEDFIRASLTLACGCVQGI